MQPATIEAPTSTLDDDALPDAAHPVNAAEPIDVDIADRLERLADLHRRQVLTDEELAMAKSMLLVRPGSLAGIGAVPAEAAGRRILPEVHPVDTALSLTAFMLGQVAVRLERRVAQRRSSREAARPTARADEPARVRA